MRSIERRLARERSSRAESELITERITATLYDTVQQLTRSTRLAELLSDIAGRANEASTVREAVAHTLASVCAYTGWPVGHALARDPGVPHSVVSMGVWHLDPAEPYAGFRSASEASVFPSGVGLPGEVLRTGAPVWAADLAAQPDFPRRQSALGCGLGAGLAIPVLLGRETAAVLEFFSPHVQQRDERLLQAVVVVGAQLGRVMEREAAAARLTRLATVDELTGLANRPSLRDGLRDRLDAARRENSRVDVLYLDVDDFKAVNDNRGHAAGDEVLAALAERLQAVVRRSDVVGRTSANFAARLGGDEFAIVLGNCPDPVVVAERICAALTQPLHLSDGEIYVSVSVGTAQADLDAGPDDVLAAANLAMHESKRNGKGGCTRFQAQMLERSRARHRLGEQLREAVQRGEFTLAYQPVVDLTGGRIVGAEALVRWQHSDGRQVPPDEFIGRAEETGLIVALGSWVLRTACRQAATWRAISPGFIMGVNVSGRQLREADFVEQVHGVLRASGLAADGLCLEVTESVLMGRDASGVAQLTALRVDGVHVSIDDFGTGFSSLAALRQLPVDQLKIDRSFVRPLPDDADAGAIARAVIQLGQTLGLSVLAEGVETERQRDLLRRYGCDQAQGYLFGRPIVADQFASLLATQCGSAPGVVDTVNSRDRGAASVPRQYPNDV